MAVAAVGTFLAANAGTIAAATMAGQALMQGIQARKQAEAQQEYQQQRNKRALESMQDQYSQLSGAEADARERSLEETMDNQVEAAKRRSRINLMAAASGTQGLSVDSMMQDISRNQGRNMNTIISNQDIELQGFRNQAEQIRTGTANRIDKRKIQRPSWGEIGLSTASAGLQGYMTGTDLKASMGNSGNPGATLQQGNGFGSLGSSVNYGAAQSVSGGV